MSDVPARPFLTARWVNLVMLNYEAEPRVLEPLVPNGTVLDLWNGRCLVTVSQHGALPLTQTPGQGVATIAPHRGQF